MLSAAPIDDAVAKAFLAAVVPADLEALDRAQKMRRDAEEGLRRAAAQQVERLRYQASLAERQFSRADPDNRLVAAELERRWEAALAELRHAEEAIARDQGEPAADAGADSHQLRSKAAALGQRLPAIWADPATDRARRKALLRCLIDKVVLRRAARDRAAVRIAWRGGATTELVVGMPVNALAALPRSAEFEARVLELARSGLHDEEDRPRADGGGLPLGPPPDEDPAGDGPTHPIAPWRQVRPALHAVAARAGLVDGERHRCAAPAVREVAARAAAGGGGNDPA